MPFDFYPRNHKALEFTEEQIRAIITFARANLSRAVGGVANAGRDTGAVKAAAGRRRP